MSFLESVITERGNIGCVWDEFLESVITEHLPGQHDQKSHGRKKGGGALQDKKPRQKQTETPEFKKWFGDSKVVDENGDPLRVYHGTADQFDEFIMRDLGDDRRNAAFFSNNQEVASGYAGGFSLEEKEDIHSINQATEARDNFVQDLFDRIDQRTPDREQARDHLLNQMLDSGDITRDEYDRFWELEDRLYDIENEEVETPVRTPNVKPVYLRMENPRIVDAGGVSWDVTVPRVLNNTDRTKHDGIIWYNIVDNPNGAEFPSTTYAVFKPTQIKSATGNRGTFDPDSPDIRESFLESVITEHLGPGGHPSGSPQQAHAGGKGKSGDADLPEFLQGLDLSQIATGLGIPKAPEQEKPKSSLNPFRDISPEQVDLNSTIDPNSERGVAAQTWLNSMSESQRSRVQEWKNKSDWIRDAQKKGEATPDWDAALNAGAKFRGTVFRGFNQVPVNVINQWAVGETITLAADSSSSKSQSVTEIFTDEPDFNDVLWEVEQSSGVDLFDDATKIGSNFGNESEVVLRKGSQYQVIGRGMSDTGIQVVKLREVQRV